MKFSNRAITLSAAVISLSIGIAVGSAFSFPNANAASQSNFELTGTLSVPGVGNPLKRIEDKEEGVICYMFPSGMFSCVKK